MLKIALLVLFAKCIISLGVGLKGNGFEKQEGRKFTLEASFSLLPTHIHCLILPLNVEIYLAFTVGCQTVSILVLVDFTLAAIP